MVPGLLIALISLPRDLSDAIDPRPGKPRERILHTFKTHE
jgi:hypothetical protein